jgi:hypothetical protein
VWGRVIRTAEGSTGPVRQIPVTPTAPLPRAVGHSKKNPGAVPPGFSLPCEAGRYDPTERRCAPVMSVPAKYGVEPVTKSRYPS